MEPDSTIEPVDQSAQEPNQAQLLYDNLQNLDRRGEALNQLIVPGQDLPPGMSWDDVRSLAWGQSQNQEPEYQPDPYESFAPQQPQFLGYDQQGQPVFDQPQQNEQFDPRSLMPVFEHNNAQVRQEIMQEIQQQQQAYAFDQNLSEGVDAAAREYGLSDFAKSTITAMARNAAQSQTNIAPAQIAQQIAKQYVTDANERFVKDGGVPTPPNGQIPGGPVPGEKRPTTEAEALEWSSRPGVMNG